jgi:hypothetical protein
VIQHLSHNRHIARRLLVDCAIRLLQDTFVATDPQAQADLNKRRSSRVLTRVTVRASGKNIHGQKFRETCQTILVNAHGGLLYINEPVQVGGDILITNPATEEEQECRIVYLGEFSKKGHRVGIEFLSPAPHFWGIEFAPDDWRGRPAAPADSSAIQ